jgi:hypothetical protein
MADCVDHLNCTNETCPDCGEHVDQYGNTESRFEHCAFPDCGCDGERLCMAERGASERAVRQNVEGMWSGKTVKQRLAAMSLMADCCKEAENG